MEKQLDKQIKLTSQILRQMVSLGVVLVVIMLGVQLGVLTILGTKGAEITAIRSDKQFYREEIDRVNSEIDSAKTLAQIQGGINIVFRDNRQNTKPININLPKQQDDLATVITGNDN